MTVLERLKRRTNAPDEALLEDFLESAKSVVLSARFPYGYPDGQEVEPQYMDVWYRIALAMYDKDGADFESAHSENGISRSWGSEGVPQSLLNEIVPMCCPVR